jgi:hypothetical protein
MDAKKTFDHVVISRRELCAGVDQFLVMPPKTLIVVGAPMVANNDAELLPS